jgi:hypothetical protein
MMMEERSDPRGLSTTSRDSVSEHNLQHKKPPPVNIHPRFFSYELKKKKDFKVFWLLGLWVQPTFRQGAVTFFGRF